MLIACMPEATIDKDRHFPSGKCNIRSASTVEDERQVDTKPQTASVQFSPKFYLA
jgi:hypothetical protein